MKLTNNINYHGDVTISVKTSLGKVISTQTYKNAGTKNLFKFLCYCIAGNYEIIDGERPFKLCLFYNTSTSPDDLSTGIMWPLMPIYLSANKVADVSPVLDTNDANEIKNYEVILHFLIPYSYISVPAANPQATEIRQICLYSKTATQATSKRNNYKDYSASFLLTKNKGTNWDGIALSNMGNNSYNLIIDWKMTFNIDKK